MINFKNFVYLKKAANEISEHIQLIISKEKTEKEKEKELKMANYLLRSQDKRKDNCFSDYEIYIKGDNTRITLITKDDVKVDIDIDTDLILAPNFTHFLKLQMNV
ncbi:hypothetical protein [Photobacterium phosphoreum]|uniref:hypothetical protein n=1 Tax=Photobacterium phosphoreum TaxID=659 RepID=UPI0039B059A5